MSLDVLRLPDFVIVGAMKGGTTSLARYLDEHPDVFVPKHELHFFDRKQNWQRGAQSYASYFDAHRHVACVGEKTPAYSYRPALNPPIPQRMAAIVPDAELIWCLRDPVERAYSQYWHNVTHGVETRTFQKALDGEGRVTVPVTHAYRDRSVYVAQIRHFLESYPLEQMLFILTERLSADPQPVLAKTFAFLGVDPQFVGRRTAARRNVARRMVGPLWCQDRIGPLLRHLKPGIRKQIEALVGVPRPLLARETRMALQDFYRPHNAALAELTGLDLSVWM